MAAENIGTVYPTKIPGLEDPADIQAALKLYHYGTSQVLVELECGSPASGSGAVGADGRRTHARPTHALPVALSCASA